MQVLEYHFILFPTDSILQNWYYFWLLQLLRMNYITCWCHWPCQDSEPHTDGEESVDHIRTLPMQFSTHTAGPYHYVVHWSEYICLPWAWGSVLKLKQCWWKCNMLTSKLKLAKYNQASIFTISSFLSLNMHVYLHLDSLEHQMLTIVWLFGKTSCWSVIIKLHRYDTDKTQLVLNIFSFYKIFTFSIQAFKCQISAVAGPPLNLNSYFGTLFSLSHEKNAHLMRQQCPIFPWKVKDAQYLRF